MLHICKSISAFSCAILAAAVLLVPQPVFASDGALRVDIAGRQRMLSQRIAKNICAIILMGDEKYGEDAKSAIKLFDWSLRVLKDGGGQGIAEAEMNPSVRSALDIVSNQWFHLGPHYWTLAIGRYDPNLTAEMIEENLLLLTRSDAVVTEIEIAYRDRAQATSALRTINRAGRMRMLSEKAVKEACFILSNYRPDEMVDNLENTVQALARGLQALANGDESDLVSAPPNDQISGELVKMTSHWNAMQPVLVQLAAGEVIDVDAFRALHASGEAFVMSADNVTYLYTQHFSHKPN